VFEIVKTASGYATTPTILVTFNGTNGANPAGGLIADASGNLFGTTTQGGASSMGTVFEIAKTASGYATTPTILVSFDGTNGANQQSSLIFDANGNLFGTTAAGGPDSVGTVFEIVKTASGYATTPTILVTFNGTNGAYPYSSLLADANGNLFGTTNAGGAYGDGNVFEIVKTATGYATTPTILVTFNGTNGASPHPSPIADASGNLFGTTYYGVTPSACETSENAGCGTVYEITGSGFVPLKAFAGTPGKANCYGQSVSALTKQYGGLNNAAAALGYLNVSALQNAIEAYCEA